MQKNSITPVILVGGKGRRLGRDKVLLSLKGEFIIYRTYIALKAVFSRAPLFVGREELPFPCRAVQDVIKGIGPKGGLLSAFLHTETDYIFITACDMPFINKDLLEYMINTLDPKSEIYIPLLKNGYIEPMFAFYKRSILKDLEKEIQQRDYRMRTLLNGHRVRYITEREIEQFDRELITFLNINTKNDLKKALDAVRDEKD